MVDAMVAGSGPAGDLYYEYYPYQDPYCPIRPDQYGPVTVPMVSTSSSPPMALPVQVPHGHVVQQIVDESGTLRHVILSPQHHPPILPMPQPFGGGGAGASNGQGYYPGPIPHGFGPFNPLQPPVLQPHPQGHSPPPINFLNKDERTQRQHSKLKRKLEAKLRGDNCLNTTPPLSPRKEVNGSGGGSRKGVSSVGTSEDGEESSSLQDEEEDVGVIAELLSTIKPPQVSEVTSRTSLVQWSPPGVENPQDLRYEVLLSDRGKEGKYKSIYSGEALSCRIEDLRPGTEYFVCVSARLEPIVGKPSDPEVLVTPACRPDPPPPPKLASRSRNALMLKWQAVVDNGAHIDHYVVEWEVNGQWTEVAKSKSKQAHIAKLQPATPFKFRVAAVNQYGQSDFSPAVTYETCDSPPPQPTAPVLSRAGPTSLTVEWMARPQDDEFTLQMEEPDSRHGFLAVYNGKDTAHTITGLAPNAQFKFRLKSANEEGPSRWSEDVVFWTQPGRPGPPSRPVLKNKAHPYSLRLRWEPPTDRGGAPISLYRLQIAPYTNQQGEFETVYEGAAAWCTVERLSPGSVYQARVCCEGPGGVSDYSDAALFATEPVAPGQPAPPRLASRPRPHQIPLKWSYPENDGGAAVTEMELAVRDCSSDESAGFTTRLVGRETEATISDLSPATTYRFILRAANKVGYGVWSEPLEVTSGSAAPSKPGPPAVSLSAAGVAASWTPPAANGSPIMLYTLQMSTPATDTFQPVYSGPALCAEVRPVPPASLCLFRLQAVNSVGGSDWSDVSSVLTAAGPPGAVGSLRSSAGPTTLTLTWTAPSDNGNPVTRYTVDAGDTTVTVTDTRCVLDNLQPNTTYRVRVRAVNGVGSGAPATVRSATLALPPRPPALQLASAGHNHLKLRWPAADSPLNYTLYMTAPTPASRHRSVVYHGTSSGYKVSRLQEQTTYTFTIVAANSTGKGEESEPVSFTTTIAPPPVVKGVKVSEVTQRNCQVEWSPVRPMGSDTLEYIVQCTRLKEQSYKQVYRGRETKCCVRDLESGADYLVRVAAVRLCGSEATPRPDGTTRSSVDGSFSPPLTFSTPAVVHDPTTLSYHPRHLTQPTARRPLSDQQWAGIILCCFTVLAVFFAMIVANIIY